MFVLDTLDWVTDQELESTADELEGTLTELGPDEKSMRRIIRMSE